MPWEIRVVHEAEDVPLGDRESVCAWVAAALPGVELRRPPPPEILDSFPPAVREAFLRPKLEAVYEGDGVSIEFYCPDAAEIRCLHADVRGSGNPVPALARLCGPRKWAVLSVADKTRVDLAAAEAPQWRSFCGWRDRAVQQTREGE